MSAHRSNGTIINRAPTVSLNYRFQPGSRVRPYLGAGVNGFYTSDEEVKGDLVTGGALGNIVVNDSKVDPWIYGILIGTTFQASSVPLMVIPGEVPRRSARAGTIPGAPGLAQPPPDVPPAEIFMLILPTLYTVR